MIYNLFDHYLDSNTITKLQKKYQRKKDINDSKKNIQNAAIQSLKLWMKLKFLETQKSYFRKKLLLRSKINA